MLLKLPFAGVTFPPSVSRRTNLEILEVAATFADRTGLWLEFGVYRGHSINHISARTDALVYGFDSFQGLPSDWGPSTPIGVFSTHGQLPQVNSNVVLVKGLFEDSLPTFLAENAGSNVSFVHLDCDLYESGRTVLRALTGRFHPGSVLVFDDFLGALPNDLYRAFRQWVVSNRIEYEWLAYSPEGAVAVRILSGPK